MKFWLQLAGLFWPAEDIFTDPMPGQRYPQVLRTEKFTESAVRSIGGVLAALVGYAVLVPTVALALIAVSWAARGAPEGFTKYRETALSYANLDGFIVAHLAIATMLVFTWIIVRYIHDVHPKWLCSVQPGMRWRYLLACLLTSLVILNAVYWLTSPQAGKGWHPNPDLAAWLIAIVLLVPLQAAAEEFFFRGYLMQACGVVVKSPWLAVLLSAVIFAAMHGNQDMPLLVDRFGFGLLAGALVVLTGGLEGAIAAHVINNVFAFAYAALSGDIMATKGMTTSNWHATIANLTAYFLAFVVAYFSGKKMRVATKTPGLVNC